MTLAELQGKLQAGFVDDDQAILASIRGSRRTDPATLFVVYHDAYRRRLAEFLSHDFPMLWVRLGEKAFGRLVEDYIMSAPLRQRNAPWYGARLADFIRETQPRRANRRAIDLARFERALSDAFDAAVSSIAVLVDFCTEDGPRIAFEFDTSLALLARTGGAAKIYAALASGPRRCVCWGFLNHCRSEVAVEVIRGRERSRRQEIRRSVERG